MTPFWIKPKIVVADLDISLIRKLPLGDKILILISGSVRRLFPIMDQLFDTLSESGKLWVYDHIRPDAPFEDLDRIIADMPGDGPDFIIAIGGGSVIDAAKALSVSFSGASYKDIFYGLAEVPERKVQLLAIPTTAGTGAELSYGAILYDQAKGIKSGIRGEKLQPDYVIIDPRLHQACPVRIKAEVGFDCLTHAMETYISRKSNPLIRVQSVSCIQVVLKYLPMACREQSLDAMERIAIFSSLMGINLAYSSTCLPHRIQYVIGPMTGTSHAQGLIALYRGWIPHLLEEKVTAYQNLSKDLGMSPEMLHQRIRELKEDLEIDYSLQDLGVVPGKIPEIAKKVTGNLTADPSFKNLQSVENILKLAQ